MKSLAIYTHIASFLPCSLQISYLLFSTTIQKFIDLFLSHETKAKSRLFVGFFSPLSSLFSTKSVLVCLGIFPHQLKYSKRSRACYLLCLLYKINIQNMTLLPEYKMLKKSLFVLTNIQ